MSGRASRLAAPAIVLHLVASFLMVLRGRNPITDSEALIALSFTSFAVIGAMILGRDVNHVLARLFLAAGTLAAASAAADNYAIYSIKGQHDLPGELVAAWFQNWSWFLPIGLIVTFGILLFPTGKLPGPSWRHVLRLAALALSTMTVGLMLNPESLDGFPAIENPTAVAAFTAVPVTAVGFAGVLVTIVLSITSLMLRFRRSRGIEREQMKWVFYAFTTMLVLILGVFLLGGNVSESAIDILFGLAFSLVPIACGVAMLRYRLYDIDIIINRTLVYALLTAALLGSYLLIVVVVSRVLEPVTRDSDIAIAASTLAVAALFRPLRARFQSFIDRRFYRTKYDSAEALKDFSARLRDEIEVDVVRDDVLGVVRDTLHPKHVSVWIKPGEAT